MLKLHLEPADATAVPGTPVMLTAVVTNDGDAVRACVVRVVGLEAPWVEHSDGELTVPSGSRLEIPIRITLPHGFPRGETLIGIEVQGDGDERPLVADARLGVSDLESLSFGLSPVTVRGGWRGRFRLNLENRGAEPLTIKLSGRGVGPDDTTSELDFRFKPEDVTLRPGERVKTRGTVTGKRHLFGQPRRRALTVSAQGQTAPRHVQGAFVQRPLMPKSMLRIVGLVLILAMWAGALTTGVRLTSKSAKSSTAQAASATLPAGTGGPSGTDGSTGAGGSGSGASQTQVPATGGAIAGQVKGPQDASDITVSLRPVALADDLGDQVTLISATTGADPGKESAQTLRRAPTGPVGPTTATTTDGDGRWAFGGLQSPANYELTFAKAGFASRTYIVTVDDQTPSVALDVSMVPGNGALSGTISSSSGPIGGATVTVTDGTVTFKTTTPDSGDVGTWSVDGLTTPGTYVVSATHRGYGTETTSVALGSGDTKGGVDLRMTPGVGSISGHVTGAGTKLGNIVVTATNGDVTRTATTLTEGDPGAFSLPQLPIPGTYTVSVAGDGWTAQTLSLDLKGNASKVDLDLVRTTATIIGTVKDATGKPLASTGITLAQDKPIVKTLSAIDPAGSYELTGLTPGTYTLTFDRADFKSEATIVTVAAGERKTVDQALTAQVGDKVPKDAVVRGIVRSSTTGNAVAGVQVTTNATTVTTDATGGFTFDKLAPGSYNLAFAQASYQPTTRTVRIGAKSDTTIDVTMLTLGGIQGVVSDLTATPIAGVTVTVTNDPAATGQAAFTASTTTDGTGQFSLLERLQTGKYIATFTKAGYETRARNFDAAAGSVATGDTTLIELGVIFGTIQEPNAAISGGFVGLAGASISLTDLSGHPITDPAVSITIDTPVVGQYTIIGLSPGDYKVTASKAGYQTAPKTLTGLKLREIRDGSVVLNQLPQTVSGHVSTTDANGNSTALVGAQVDATIVTGFNTLTVFPYIQPRTATRTVFTDGTGAWTIPATVLVGGVTTDNGPITGTSGSYTVQAVGYTTRTLAISTPDVNGDANVVVTALPHTVSGGVKLAGASGGGTTTVTVSLSGGGLASPRTLTPAVSNDNTTVAAYTFTTPKVAVGSYNLTFTAVGFDPLTVPITVTTAGDLVVPDQTLSKLGAILVTATSGTALSGATVDLKRNGTVVASRTTDVNGQTTFSSLAPTSGSVAYTVTTSRVGYASDTDTVVAVAAGATAAHNPNLARWSTLTVHLKSRLSPGADTALSGATVQLVSVDGFGNPASLTNVPEVGTSGDYSLPSVAPNAGGYTLSASKTGFADNAVTIFPVAGSAEVQTLALLANPKIRVTLVSRQAGHADAALAGATVTATPTSGGGSAIPATDVGSGDYLTTNLDPTLTYRIDASAAGHAAGLLASIGVTAGATATPTVTLDKYPAIKVHVDKQVNGATSNLTGSTSVFLVAAGTTSPTLGTLTESPASSGDYVINGAAPGTYDVYVNQSGYVTASSSSSVTTVAGQSDQTAPTVTVRQLAKISVHVDKQVAGGTPTPFSGTVILTAPGTTSPAVGTFTESPASSGNYSIAPSPGTYDIVVNPAGYDGASDTAANAVTTTAGGADQTATGLTVRKWPTATVTLTSHRTGVAPDPVLSGASVVFTLSGNDPSTQAVQTLTAETPASSGTYATSSLPPGNYDVYVTAPGHDQASSLFAGGFGVSTTGGGSDVSLALTLQKRPDLQVTALGRVTVGSPAVDTDSALTNGTITATCTTPLTCGTDVVTLANQGGGVYLGSTLRPGTYTVRLKAPGFTTQTKSVSLTAGGAQVSLASPGDPEVVLAAVTGSVTGTVRKLDGTVLPGVTVTAISNGSVFSTTTSASGVYTISGLAPVTWTVSYQASGFSSLVQSVTVPKGTAFNTGGSATADTILVELGATMTGKTFGVATTGVTTGTVDNPVIALDQVVVNLTGAASRQQTVSADGSGNYAYGFSDLPAGTYQLQFTRNGYVTRTVSGIALSTAQVVARQDTLTATAGSVTVTVTSSVAPNAAVQNIGIRLESPLLSSGHSSTLNTDSNGQAVFTSLPPGAYNAVVQTVPTGWVLDATPHAVTLPVSTTTSAPTATLAFTIVPRGSLQVTVTGLGGAAVNNATVTVTGPTSTSGSTDATGVVTIPNLVPGSYTFDVSATSYDAVNGTSATISAGATTAPATVALTPTNVSLTVTVLDNGGGVALATAGTVVELFKSGVSQGTHNTGGGTAVFPTVRPATAGTYTITVTSSGYTTQSSVAVSVGLGPTGATATVDLLAANINVIATVAGLVGTESATVTVKDGSGNSIGSASRSGNGDVTISVTMANLGPSETVSFTASSVTGYSVSGPVTGVVLHPGDALLTSQATLTYTPDTVSLTMNFNAGNNGETVTLDSGSPSDSHSHGIAGNSATVTGLIPGHTYTITVTTKTSVAPPTYLAVVGTNGPLSVTTS